MWNLDYKNNMSTSDSFSKIIKGFGLLCVIAAIIIISVLVGKGTLQFHWAYITAPKLFWSIFFTAWLWDVYFYIVFWIVLLFKAIRK